MTAGRSLREALRELSEGDASLVHPTYRHLERRTRLFGLTFLQWAQVTVCVLAAWLLSRVLPLPGPYDVSVAVTLAGIPAAAAVVATDADHDVLALLRGLRSWRTARAIYLPGEHQGIQTIRGYALTAVSHDGTTPASERRRGARGMTARRRSVGELLPVEALDQDGLLVRSDGAFVRYLQVVPSNPLVLDEQGCDRMTRGLTDLLLRVPAGTSVQLYAEATHVTLDDLLQEMRAATDAGD